MTTQEAISATNRVFEYAINEAEEALAALKESAENYNAMLVYAQDLQAQCVELVRIATRLQTLEATANLKHENTARHHHPSA